MKQLFSVVVLCALCWAGPAFADTNLPVTASSKTNAAPKTHSVAVPQTKAKPAASAPAAKGAGYPFRGKLAAVNVAGGTVTIGKSTYYISAETKLYKDGVLSRLADFKSGESVVGYARRGADGRANASSMRVGAKPAPSEPPKPKK